jgi:hypothetical protein
LPIRFWNAAYAGCAEMLRQFDGHWHDDAVGQQVENAHAS